VYFIWGLAGLYDLAKTLPDRTLWRVLGRAWGLSLVLITGLFFVFGAGAYQSDVGFIESEMVQTARWINANTDVRARIAAHDIGALGFFSQRELIDLAGLVSPEVIPFIRDEARLAAYLDNQRADYWSPFRAGIGHGSPC
jgi:hypothetical protein